MKLKYYLRGLGIGIFVTTFLVARLQGTATVADEPVREPVEETHFLQEREQTEAEDLTLENTEETVEAEFSEAFLQEEEEATMEEEEAVAEEEQPREEQTNISEETQPAPEPSAAEVVPPAKETQPVMTESAEQFVVIPIYSGEGSETVARRLQDSGVISSAAVFDKFLCQNGYDRKLVVGQHEIPAGATDEEIAQIMCRK